MSAKIRHRGPDWSGIYSSEKTVLAHERLAIVDPLSGGQPLYSPDGKKVLAVNGEIYNHQLLRAETKDTYEYKTGSDCEVILALYERYGIHFIEKLNGIFSFVLYDSTTDDYIIARDAMGVIPLYIGHDEDGTIYAASELKALEGECKEYQPFPPGHYAWSRMKESEDEKTKELFGGQVLLGKWYRRDWFQYDGMRWITSDRAEAVQWVKTALMAAVKRQLMSDVPYGVLLSGGLDSSVVSAIAKRYSAKRIELSDFATNVELDEARDFEPGDVARPVKAIVDIDKFKAVAHQKKSEYDLDLHVVNKETGDEIRSFSLQWNEREGLHVFYGGVGDAGYSVTLFAVLDVDANPTSIRFSGEQANPRVEDTFRIETVVAPTKSCNVVCKDVYSVNGELQETPEYSVMVTVPVFFDGAFGNQYNLTADLATDPDMGDLQMQRVADKYRYDPQSIFDNRQNKDSGSSTANAGGSTSTSTSADTAATAKAASSETKAASTSETKMSAEEYAEKYPGVKASTPEGFSMRIEPFWGVWATASKDMDEARSFVESARSEAFEAQAFISSDWENLNPETWYVVSLGCSDTEEEANAILTRARKWGYEDAYVKYSGKRL